VSEQSHVKIHRALCGGLHYSLAGIYFRNNLGKRICYYHVVVPMSRRPMALTTGDWIGTSFLQLNKNLAITCTRTQRVQSMTGNLGRNLHIDPSASYSISDQVPIAYSSFQTSTYLVHIGLLPFGWCMSINIGLQSTIRTYRPPPGKQ
jgi:hypothetical protein